MSDVRAGIGGMADARAATLLVSYPPTALAGRPNGGMGLANPRYRLRLSLRDLAAHCVVAPLGRPYRFEFTNVFSLTSGTPSGSLAAHHKLLTEPFGH